MNIYNLFKQKKKNDLKDRTKIIVKDGLIPYSELVKPLNNKIAFIVITTDEKVLQASANAIINFHKAHKEKDITVLVSSSYETLHRLTNGAL